MGEQHFEMIQTQTLDRTTAALDSGGFFFLVAHPSIRPGSILISLDLYASPLICLLTSSRPSLCSNALDLLPEIRQHFHPGRAQRGSS